MQDNDELVDESLIDPEEARQRARKITVSEYQLKQLGIQNKAAYKLLVEEAYQAGLAGSQSEESDISVVDNKIHNQEDTYEAKRAEVDSHWQAIADARQEAIDAEIEATNEKIAEVASQTGAARTAFDLAATDAEKAKILRDRWNAIEEATK